MGFFKLGKMTLGSLFKKPETICYPFESKTPPAGLKGHIVIDIETCILCGMCDRSCTADAIAVDKAARTWSVDPFRCIQCGYCVQVCPKKCLSMDPAYWSPASAKEPETFEVPEHKKPAAEQAEN